jgi:hypothetical protein
MDRPSRPVCLVTYLQPARPASPLAFRLTEKGREWGILGTTAKECGHLYSFLFPGGNYGAGVVPNMQLEEMGLCYSLFLCLIIQAIACLHRQFALGQDTAAY